jgi:hypothetical protein
MTQDSAKTTQSNSVSPYPLQVTVSVKVTRMTFSQLCAIAESVYDRYYPSTVNDNVSLTRAA